MSDLLRPGPDGELGNAAEGYLLWHATVTEAERRAREFAEAMDWLTTSQREEIERCYVADSLKRARKDIERVAARCLELRAEYEHRYRSLRRRCVGLALTICAASTAAVTLLLLM
ncbi:cytochrome C oxidase subunit I [Streptomyces sp. NPDC002769]|uniref:cytochrome C oxidase subunit I n=1 Tax=Streptomyces sp. NPDC002769 TaxID=3154542 RepID=UPI00331CE89B